MIRLERLNKFYQQGDEKIHVLKDVSLQIQQGEFVAIMGPSGSGKSTLINIIGFLDHQFMGQYRFKGESMIDQSLSDYARLRNQNVGFVFQNFKLISNLSVAENVGLPLLYAGHRRKNIADQVNDVLSSVNLQGVGAKLPMQLSGGQQQRVAIARALITRPSFLLADEPTGALDSHTSQEILKLFIDLNHKSRSTIIMVTHDFQVARLSQRIIRILDGRIESDRSVDQ
ncbi:ABC transporter ATP-binding protein [Sporolactobacillus shoreicorticis]|uniref:ABC transporter ATP-binding protein n=1 Tax=Sporolactobacillus shoreicorticis TaxID=1923877 RepID=A0ABW5S6P8_9BACL|nr:ABC transporter ATP-binding protein [Sporolactobacillus shoreicorticis]MCO7128202.1 ABC transporter ATP-binding protein [Sporolactobacillus shoreicorticis]